MELNEIIKYLGEKIETPKGTQLLAGLQIGVLTKGTQLKPYPCTISLICWSEDGGQYHHSAVDCKSKARHY
jgi:hypothetical protein